MDTNEHEWEEEETGKRIVDVTLRLSSVSLIFYSRGNRWGLNS